MRTLCLIASLLFFCFWFLRCEGCLEEERNALLQLRDSFNYPNGFYLKDEWVGKNCCDWQMVTCDFNSSTYQVVEIYFYGYREDGQGKWYPNATLFTHFKGLRRLILDGNNIGGWIMPQALCGLKNLRFLDLSYNNLDDEGLPRCLAGELSFLEQLIISYNRRSISLSLLTALCGLRSLRVLDLSGSILSNDSIPTCLLHKKSSLETLKLTGCTLDGSPGVLKAICRARNIKKLYLGDNNLSDESLQICPLYNLSSLEILHLSFNNIKASSDFLTGGTIPGFVAARRAFTSSILALSLASLSIYPTFSLIEDAQENSYLGCKHAINDDGGSTSTTNASQLKSCVSRSFQVAWKLSKPPLLIPLYLKRSYHLIEGIF